MRFVHLADLHLGRSLAEFSLIELQREILGQIIDYIRHNDVDAVVIAGDVPSYYANPEKAAKLLNWHTEKTLDDMCRDSWAFKSKNPNGYEA